MLSGQVGCVEGDGSRRGSGSSTKGDQELRIRRTPVLHPFKVEEDTLFFRAGKTSDVASNDRHPAPNGVLRTHLRPFHVLDLHSVKRGQPENAECRIREPSETKREGRNGVDAR
ncbi:predicted protein [Coccidioides posadasii str. Silveira]|uniref:Predicted protein n=1 Tax=Coccidioides posadasii (strain RMSCC 757 / Silveira) TaxID=443226 RepID=E9DAP5_COCPS|nr:predicted protein [Coccidioides posadasii str. Silveira]